jgi:hypothetical protein
VKAAGDAIPLPVGAFIILRDLIRDRIGVSFDDEKRDLLAGKLADRLRALNLPSFLDYYYLLRYGPGADAEWPHLTDALSVQETYFWREFDQVASLVDVLVPEHVAAHRGPVRVWSAACATARSRSASPSRWPRPGGSAGPTSRCGPATSARRRWTRRRRGVYRERAFRALPPHLRDKYFAPADGGWRWPRICKLGYASDPRTCSTRATPRPSPPPRSYSAGTCSSTSRRPPWRGWCAVRRADAHPGVPVPGGVRVAGSGRPPPSARRGR